MSRSDFLGDLAGGYNSLASFCLLPIERSGTIDASMDEISEAGAQPKPSRVRRIIAIVLSLLDTGVGQVVMGYPLPGLAWFAASLIAYAAAVGSIAAGKVSFTLPLVVLIVGLRLAASLKTLRIPVPAVAPRKLILALIVVGIYFTGLVAGLIGTQFARAYWMPTVSMYPSLELGDHFLSSRITDTPHRGQVIVFQLPTDPTKSLVQRVIGLPGDIVEIRRGELVLNGSPVHRTALRDPCAYESCTVWQEAIDGNSHKIAVVDEGPDPDSPSREFGPVTVPAMQLFVLGENRDNSLDSRYFGFVPMELVLATPRLIYLSSGDDGVRWNRMNKAVN